MSGERLLLVYLLRGDRSAADAICGQSVLISFITCMELLSKPGMSREESKASVVFVQE
ncbi:MAG: hypothetical protein J5I62_02805 [Flavobacteriales bacterium]|nr:hypothetical protein [Flavobacteriales bacterium]MEB2340431.1 hypothetical protein [Flavobacteriia bacterium]